MSCTFSQYTLSWHERSRTCWHFLIPSFDQPPHTTLRMSQNSIHRLLPSKWWCAPLTCYCVYLQLSAYIQYIYICIWHWHLIQSSWTPIPFLFLTKDSIYMPTWHMAYGHPLHIGIWIFLDGFMTSRFSGKITHSFYWERNPCFYHGTIWKWGTPKSIDQSTVSIFKWQCGGIWCYF